MTSNELRAVFNSWSNEHGIEWKPPETYEVDHETYANVIQSIFNDKLKFEDVSQFGENLFIVNVAVGLNSGIMFKNIELILKEFKE